MSRKLLLVVNEDRFFLSHRKQIALTAQSEGFDVRVVCKDTGQRNVVESLGVPMIELPINPTGMNIKEEIKTFRFLYNLYKQENPEIVHHVGLKNILWGSLAAKFARVNAVVNAVSGLGVLFSGSEPSFTAKSVLNVMRFANRGMRVAEIFQNSDDRRLFLERHVVQPDQCEFIKGSGVDLNKFSYTPDPDSEILRVIFTARMVKEKGTLTLIEAAEKLRSEFEGKAEFLLCGLLSNNPKGIKREELERLCDGKYIKWLGHRNDVCELLRSSHIMAFPSYYREGVPLSLIEACAAGRPIITCDSIGCRDTVDDGVNGFLIPPNDSGALADRLRTLFLDKALRQKMGEAGRAKAEKEFSIESVVDKHIKIYKSLETRNER